MLSILHFCVSHFMSPSTSLVLTTKWKCGKPTKTNSKTSILAVVKTKRTHSHTHKPKTSNFRKLFRWCLYKYTETCNSKLIYWDYRLCYGTRTAIDGTLCIRWLAFQHSSRASCPVTLTCMMLRLRALLIDGTIVTQIGRSFASFVQQTSVIWSHIIISDGLCWVTSRKNRMLVRVRWGITLGSCLYLLQSQSVMFANWSFHIDVQ